MMVTAGDVHHTLVFSLGARTRSTVSRCAQKERRWGALLCETRIYCRTHIVEWLRPHGCWMRVASAERPSIWVSTERWKINLFGHLGDTARAPDLEISCGSKRCCRRRGDMWFFGFRSLLIIMRYLGCRAFRVALSVCRFEHKKGETGD